jgi:putative alpha-1,2-mannosidase
VTVTIAAVGATKQIAAAIRFPLLNAADIEKVTIDEGRRFDEDYPIERYFISDETVAIKGLDGSLVLNLFDDAHWSINSDEDNGQTSAWYIFTAMGFYPVCPGSNQYVLGAPYLPYMKVTLENGKVVEIKAPKVSDRNRYVQSVRINGKPYTKLYVTHNQLVDGCVIEFEMGAKPNKKRGLALQDKPYSMTTP